MTPKAKSTAASRLKAALAKAKQATRATQKKMVTKQAATEAASLDQTQKRREAQRRDSDEQVDRAMLREWPGSPLSRSSLLGTTRGTR